MPGSEVARYYDANTGRFLARGEGGKTGAIHRAVWGEGVTDVVSALHFAEELILREMAGLETTRPRVLDLGCGVGGSLLYLLSRRDAEGFGITLSSEQYRRAPRGSGAAFVQGDFCRDPLPPDIDLAFAIESFVHGSDPLAFFENVSRSLLPSGRLVLVDDFLAPSSSERSPISAFQWGWHAPSLMTTAQADRLAAGAGLALMQDRDLTSHLELDRPRDRALAAVLPLARPFLPDVPLVRALVGGDALRKCLKRHSIEYRFRVYRKPGP